MDVIGFPNYLIYPDGRVWSKKHSRFLTGCPNSDGYICMKLHCDKICHNLKYHRIVAIQFIPNPQNLPMVDHIDGNKQNNSVSNLRWTDNMGNLNAYKKRYSNNTSGIKNISQHKRSGRWNFTKTRFKKRYYKEFPTKAEAIAYKYIFNLKIRGGLI